jgi:hypothetical protein
MSRISPILSVLTLALASAGAYAQSPSQTDLAGEIAGSPAVEDAAPELNVILQGGVLGDGDGDGDIDLDDVASFMSCAKNGGNGCHAFDFDLDGDADYRDFGGLQIVFTGSGCDFDAGLPNDDCASQCSISDGVTPFTTIGATTDGSPEAGCAFGGQTHADIWYEYTALCTGNLEVSMCDTANYDTDLVVYEGCDCGTMTMLGCQDDAPGCAGFTSEVTVPVFAGNCYKIRVGGFNADTDQGSGTISIDCQLPPEPCELPDAPHDQCATLQPIDCQAGQPGELCWPEEATVSGGAVSVNDCACYDDGVCGSMQIDGALVTCSDTCPEMGEPCEVYLDGVTTGSSVWDVGGAADGTEVTCECPTPPIPNCNCYFSGDCAGGASCFWGPGGPATEDNCNWRLPKPSGVGTGCTEDVHTPGPICDGRCTNTALGSFCGHEDPSLLEEGIRLWTAAYEAGIDNNLLTVDPDLATEALNLPYETDWCGTELGRHVGSVIVLARGVGVQDLYCHFENWAEPWIGPEFNPDTINRDTCAVEAGKLAVEALIAETLNQGSGAELMNAIPDMCPEWETMFQPQCQPGAAALECAKSRIKDIATTLRIPVTTP